MNSSNSGSIHSSSSGDNNDFTSPADQPLSFLNFPPPPPPLTSPFIHHYSSPSFDLLSPYFAALTPDSTAALTAVHFAAAPSSSSHVSPVDGSSNPSPTQAAGQSDDLPAGASSKKRSRASRRAPTTVLTTDASNFRSMVQQFTGFPTPPFAPPSSRPRFDFLQKGGGGGADRTGPPPPYLLRPFAQKVDPSSSSFSPLSSSSSSLVEAIAYMNRTTSAAITSSLSPLIDLQSSNPLDPQSSNLAFQSILQSQTPLKYDLLFPPSPFKFGGRTGMAQMPRSNAAALDEDAEYVESDVP